MNLTTDTSYNRYKFYTRTDWSTRIIIQVPLFQFENLILSLFSVNTITYILLKFQLIYINFRDKVIYFYIMSSNVDMSFSFLQIFYVSPTHLVIFFTKITHLL